MINITELVHGAEPYWNLMLIGLTEKDIDHLPQQPERKRDEGTEGRIKSIGGLQTFMSDSMESFKPIPKVSPKFLRYHDQDSVEK